MNREEFGDIWWIVYRRIADHFIKSNQTGKLDHQDSMLLGAATWKYLEDAKEDLTTNQYETLTTLLAEDFQGTLEEALTIAKEIEKE